MPIATPAGSSAEFHQSQEVLGLIVPPSGDGPATQIDKPPAGYHILERNGKNSKDVMTILSNATSSVTYIL